MSAVTAVTPSVTADCPTWRGFLEDATQGDRPLVRFLQQIAGYCLTGDTREHALFFIYGPGGNGKSVFLNTLNGILADCRDRGQGMLAVSLDDQRLTWPERELVRQFGEKLYGKLPTLREAHHE